MDREWKCAASGVHTFANNVPQRPGDPRWPRRRPSAHLRAYYRTPARATSRPPTPDLTCQSDKPDAAALPEWQRERRRRGPRPLPLRPRSITLEAMPSPPLHCQRCGRAYTPADAFRAASLSCAACGGPLGDQPPAEPVVERKDPFRGRRIAGALLRKRLAVLPTRSVYAARHEKLGREVRVEVFTAPFAEAHMDYVRRLFAGAARTQDLHSLHVATVIDLGRLPDCCYIITESFEGDLAGLLDRRGRLPLGRALRIAEDVLQGLQAVDETGGRPRQRHSRRHSARSRRRRAPQPPGHRHAAGGPWPPHRHPARRAGRPGPLHGPGVDGLRRTGGPFRPLLPRLHAVPDAGRPPARRRPGGRGRAAEARRRRRARPPGREAGRCRSRSPVSSPA